MIDSHTHLFLCERPEDELVAAALKVPFLRRIVVRAHSATELPPNHPALEKLDASSEPAAFICVGETCSLPVTLPAAVSDAVTSFH